MARNILSRYREVEISSTGVIVGALNSTPYSERVEEAQRQGFFNTLAIMGFIMSTISFLDSRK